MRLLSVGSLPPAWGGRDYGGVATLHATLLEAFLEPECPVELIGVVPPSPVERPLPVPVFVRASDEMIADFYERLLERLRPDAVVMHHFAHTIGVTHARISDPPPAIGIAHSWHQLTFRSGEARESAREATAEALGGLVALSCMSDHCRREGEELDFSYPPLVETIHHPLQPLYAAPEIDARIDSYERRGVAYLGSLIPRKNPAGLVEAAARLPGTDFVIAGHGELEEELRALIETRSLADRVEIRSLYDIQVRDLLLRSRAMCMPSHSETFGLAYIEALACGTPVIGFGPTLREIRDRVGVEIGEPLDDNGPAAIAAAIERVLAASWDRSELRRCTLEAFSLPEVAQRYADLIARAIAGERTRTPARAAGRSVSAAPASPEASAICVLGMSRSGTSLTARLLDLAGVYLGPEKELLGGQLSQIPAEDRDNARAANPDGFYEHYRLMRLSERVLRRLGGNWREPPPLHPGWEQGEDLAEERREARELLHESFSGHSPWGWKDPRLSLTLPFWLPLVPDLRCIICLRDPEEVAASLRKRDGLPFELGLELWLIYVASALVNSAGRPRLLVSFGDYFDDPASVSERLVAFVGRPGALDGAAGRRRVEEAIDPGLWRNRVDEAGRGDAAGGDDSLPREIDSLHLATRLLAAAAPQSSPATAGLHAAVDDYARRLLDAGTTLGPSQVNNQLTGR